jgi:hypothetical protein
LNSMEVLEILNSTEVLEILNATEIIWIWTNFDGEGGGDFELDGDSRGSEKWN